MSGPVLSGSFQRWAKEAFWNLRCGLHTVGGAKGAHNTQATSLTLTLSSHKFLFLFITHSPWTGWWVWSGSQETWDFLILTCKGTISLCITFPHPSHGNMHFCLFYCPELFWEANVDNDRGYCVTAGYYRIIWTPQIQAPPGLEKNEWMRKANTKPGKPSYPWHLEKLQCYSCFIVTQSLAHTVSLDDKK